MKQFKPLDLVPISELLSPDFKFYVPSYQRGYRWNADQVEQLIDDLEEFEKYHYSSDNSKFYCLQPLVVKKKDITKKENERTIDEEVLEVIDGQQRLTTILIILQALHLRKRILEGDQASDVKTFPNMYSVQYETRKSSSTWLTDLNQIIADKGKKEEFANMNCDYYHFAEVFDAAYAKVKDWDEDKINDFGKVLRKGTMFIWYSPTEAAGTNADIFDRLNAGKISLNNAELIKALFIQKSNWSDKDIAYSKSLSLEWDAIENQLQDTEFWGFIYRSRHPYSYDTHIEYLFDLLQRKNESHRDNNTYTFNCYLDSYRKMMDNNKAGQECKAQWVKERWTEIKELFDTLNEWYNDKKVYHRIGFILEYINNENFITLQDALKDKKHSERKDYLDELIRTEMSKIKSKRLFYGNYQMSEVLFLYNILLEDRRISDKARFSFASYKDICKNKGWDQEHVASHTDYSPDVNHAKELSMDIIELILGNKLTKENNEAAYTIDYENYNLDDEEKKLCERAISILNAKKEPRPNDDTIPEEQTDIYKFYEEVQKHFKTDEDEFTAKLSDGSSTKKEKDFIWNFVLLNAQTNRSYGNHIFPVKRRRILQDEYNIYTPVGTRNVFEKAYSRKSDQIFYWSKSDAKSYWEDLKSVLSPYVQLNNPF